MSRILLTIIAVAIVAQIHGQTTAPILAVIDRTFASAPATVSIGGQISAVSAIATSGTDFSAPLGGLAAGTITFGFTPVTAVPIGGKIYVELPLNYFSAVDDTKELTFTGTAATKAKCALTKAYNTAKDKDLVTCTTSAAILAAGASTMIFPASSVTLGPATAASAYKLWTSTDIAFATPANTLQIGGVLGAVYTFATSGTDFSAPLAPGAKAVGTITIGFTPVTAVPIGGKIYVELPLNYFSAVDDTQDLTFTGTAATKAKCALTKANTATTDLVTCTTSAAILAAVASTMIFPTLSVTLGTAQAASTGKLWTSTDRAFGTATATTAIGGALGAVYTFATSGTDFSAPLAPGAKAVGTITFGFTPVTAVPIGGKIYVELPLNYFSAVDDTKELTFTGTAATKAKCALTQAYNTAKDKDLVTCTTSAAILAAGASTMIFPTLSVALGPAQAASSGKLWTSTDIAFGTTTATTAIGGALGAVYTFATSGTDFSAPLGAKAVGTITFGFTPVTAVPIGGKIYVELPLNYFSAVDDTQDLTFTGTAATKAKCALTKAYNTAKDKDLVTCTTSAAILAAGASTMIFPTLSVTLGPPTAASAGKLWTSTDIAFGTTTATVAIGGQLTAGIAMAITAEQDKVGSNKMNNNTITVGFTVATAVPIGGKIILTLPKDYFLVVDATKTNTLTTTSATCTCVLTKAVLAEIVDTVTCTTAGATVAAAAQVLTFVSGSVRIGHSQAADTFNVRTSTDRNLATAPATVALGGVLGAGVAIAFATSTDKVPGTVNTGVVTLGFTVINVVPIGGQIVVSLPLNYFSAVDVSKINTLTTTGSTCTCILAKAATSTTDTVTCTVAGASVAAVAQTLTFIVGSVTAGSPQAASIFSVRTHSNAPAEASGGPVSGPPSTTSAKSLASNIVASALLVTTSLALALLF